jgi:hypothetical protein
MESKSLAFPHMIGSLSSFGLDSGSKLPLSRVHPVCAVVSRFHRIIVLVSVDILQYSSVAGWYSLFSVSLEPIRPLYNHFLTSYLSAYLKMPWIDRKILRGQGKCPSICIAPMLGLANRLVILSSGERQISLKKWGAVPSVIISRAFEVVWKSMLVSKPDAGKLTVGPQIQQICHRLNWSERLWSKLGRDNAIPYTSLEPAIFKVQTWLIGGNPRQSSVKRLIALKALVLIDITHVVGTFTGKLSGDDS